MLLVFAGLLSGCGSSNDAVRSTEEADPGNEVGYLNPAEARKDPDRIICRRYSPTGSRISEKICMTARQWQRATDDAREALDKAHRAPKSYPD
jgi:hypothetical protein